MEATNSILEDVREYCGLGKEDTDFDKELIPHINSALGRLNQNGIGNSIFVKDDSTTWSDFKDLTQLEGNKLFAMIPQYVGLSVKVIFDPPPPSSVEYYHNAISENLWRLKAEYETPLVEPFEEEYL